MIGNRNRRRGFDVDRRRGDRLSFARHDLAHTRLPARSDTPRPAVCAADGGCSAGGGGDGFRRGCGARAGDGVKGDQQQRPLALHHRTSLPARYRSSNFRLTESDWTSLVSPRSIDLLLGLHDAAVILKGYRNAQRFDFGSVPGAIGSVTVRCMSRFGFGGWRSASSGEVSFFAGCFGVDCVARFRSDSSSAMMSTDDRTLTCLTSGAALACFSVCPKSISGSGGGGGCAAAVGGSGDGSFGGGGGRSGGGGARARRQTVSDRYASASDGLRRARRSRRLRAAGCTPRSARWPRARLGMAPDWRRSSRTRNCDRRGARRRGVAFTGSSPVMRRRSVRSVSFEIIFSVSKTPSPRDGHRFDVLVLALGIERRRAIVVDRRDVRQVALVELQDQRDFVEVEADLGEVLAQVLEALDVRVEHRLLRVGDEDDAVDALEHELAGGVVEDLAGDGVELQAGLESADDADVDRQEVEEERAVGLRLEADHLAAALRRGLGVDVVEIGGLPAEARTVVNDLRGHLHRRVIEEDHSDRAPIERGSMVAPATLQPQRMRAAQKSVDLCKFRRVAQARARCRSRTSASPRAAGPVKRRASVCAAQLSIAERASAAMSSRAPSIARSAPRRCRAARRRSSIRIPPPAW